MSDDRRYPTRPMVGVGVVVWKGDDVLLIRRGKPPRRGEWSLPGGLQELGETVAEAAAREVREETGVEITLGPLVDVVDGIRRDEEDRVVTHYTLVDFVAEWRAGEPCAGDDAMDCRWVPADAIESLLRWPETVRVIRLSRKLRRR